MRELYPDPNHQLPRPIMIGGIALMVATVMLCAGARATGVGVSRTPDPVATVSRDLRFTEQDDGVITVRDTAQDREIERIADGEGGFIRATMRGLIRNRTRYGAAAVGDFRVTLDRDGGVWLQDLATRQNVDLQAFGPTQVQAFAAFLPRPAEPRPGDPAAEPAR